MAGNFDSYLGFRSLPPARQQLSRAEAVDIACVGNRNDGALLEHPDPVAGSVANRRGGTVSQRITQDRLLKATTIAAVSCRKRDDIL